MPSLVVFLFLVIAAICSASPAQAQSCTGFNCGATASGINCLCGGCSGSPPLPPQCGPTPLVCPLSNPVPLGTLAACCAEPTQAQAVAACQAAGLQSAGSRGAACGAIPIPNCSTAPPNVPVLMSCPAATGSQPAGCAAGLVCNNAICQMPLGAPAMPFGSMLGLGATLVMVGSGIVGAGRRAREKRTTA